MDIKVKLTKFITFRPRSEFEVRKYLGKYKLEIEEIDKLVNDFKSYGFIDDSEFTRWYITSKKNGSKLVGDNKIKLELIKKGISKDLISENLKENNSLEEEAQRIKTYLERVVPKMKFKDKNHLKQKLLARLIARGINLDEALSSVNNFLSSKKV